MSIAQKGRAILWAFGGWALVVAAGIVWKRVYPGTDLPIELLLVSSGLVAGYTVGVLANPFGRWAAVVFHIPLSLIGLSRYVRGDRTGGIHLFLLFAGLAVGSLLASYRGREADSNPGREWGNPTGPSD